MIYTLLILGATAVGSVIAVELMLLALRVVLTALGLGWAFATHDRTKEGS